MKLHIRRRCEESLNRAQDRIRPRRNETGRGGAHERGASRTMKVFDFDRCAFSICAGVFLLAGCGGSRLPIGAQGAMPQGAATTGYGTVYSFGAGSDGQNPKAGLVDVQGALYGTTYSGGAHGDGTVFRISTGGKEKILHSFYDCCDGANPSAGLIVVRGLLYGTTERGGNPGVQGTVFSITKTGTEKVLHSFRGYYQQDGASPVASLIDVSGTLYGTTEYGGGVECGGGAYRGCGSVFSVSTTGTLKLLLGFCGSYYPCYGGNPVAGLIYAKGTLWGTTESGGGADAGVVFRISTTGTEKAVYLFGCYPYSSNGCNPEAALTKVNGTLFGATANSGVYGGGTVVEYPRCCPGRPKLLHSFGSGSDGSSPAAAMLNVNGTLYGTTARGGAYGSGTIFSISPVNGAENVLHSFGYGSDGATPLGELIAVKGTLYGTTSAGGAYGKGTVFAFTP
jgi:uncharacterized repeat protein (TIGR03803 family)